MKFRSCQDGGDLCEYCDMINKADDKKSGEKVTDI